MYYWLADGAHAAWRMLKPVGVKVRSWLSWGAGKVGSAAQEHLPAVPEKAPASEVTWTELTQKFFHKLYVSVGRGSRRVYQWWNGTYDPLAIKKKAAVKKDSPALAALSAGQVVTVEPAVAPRAEQSAAPVGPKVVEVAPVAVQDAGPVAPTVPTPTVPTPAEQKKAVAAEVAAVAAEVAVPDEQANAAQAAVAKVLAAADVQVATTEKKVEKVRKNVAFIDLAK